MPGKKITPEHKEMILTLKANGYSDGQTYLQYIRRFFDEKRPIEQAITYETMRDLLRQAKLKKSKRVKANKNP